MKTFVVLALDTYYQKHDGTYPVRLRIIHHGKPASITTGIYLLEKDWDDKERKIKGTYRGTESVARLNNFLQKKKSEAMDIITKLDERKTLDTFTVRELKEMIERKPEKTSFFAYAQTLINEQKEANRIGNARSYESAIAALKKFVNGRDLPFLELNLSFLNRFEVHHLKKEKSYNGLAAYLRAVRAIYNQAIKAGLVDRELYPFEQYEIKTTKTRKRAISLQAIGKIEGLVLDAEHPLFHTRNFFLASFYMRGISFADLAELKVGHIIDGRIHYDRRKTHKPYDIFVLAELRQILSLYLPGKEKTDYIFPIIKRTKPEEQYKDIMWARKRFNTKLKDLAALCGIQENLTSYVSRHSFATGAKNQGISIAAISDMLGHENIKTTEVYLDTLPNNLLDELHAQIIRGIRPVPQQKNANLSSEAEPGTAEAQPDRNSLV